VCYYLLVRAWPKLNSARDSFFGFARSKLMNSRDDLSNDSANTIFDLRMTGHTSREPVIIEGELSQSNASEFKARLRELDAERGQVLTLDLSGLDIEDSIAVATAINSLRELSTRRVRVVLRGAPQMLCHNLYRVGLLGGSNAIELVEMRFDEPAGY
jgi:anti-anti-sigma regulatory factor